MLAVLGLAAALTGCHKPNAQGEPAAGAEQAGQAPARSDVHEAPVAYPFSDPDNAKRYELVMTPLYFKGQPLRFIEHVFDFGNNRPTRQVLAGLRASRNVILVSDDLGGSWTQTKQFNFYAGQAFTTAAGSRLVWDEGNSTLRRFNVRWEEEPVHCPARFPWHGAQGIGQHKNIIMFAEYWTDNSVPEGHVLRSTDDGETWKVAFSASSHGSTAPKAGQIRHFHTLQPDFFFPGHWYLSSGDDTPECRFWLSKDDGETWAEVTDPAPDASNLQNVHRHTSIQFFPDKVVWATDGAYRQKTDSASFVEAKRGEPLKVKALSVPMANAVRSLVATDIGLLAFTENRYGRKVAEYGKAGAEIVLLTNEGKQAYVGIDPDGAGGFTYSLASRQAVDGVFLSFVHHESGLSNLARWTLHELK
jgi:hypothetical protein